MIDVIQRMADLQHRLNIAIVGDDYIKRNLDFGLAASQEASELIDSLPWKWWKGGESVDIDNAQLECVDLWHFMLSIVIQSKMGYDVEYIRVIESIA